MKKNYLLVLAIAVVFGIVGFSATPDEREKPPRKKTQTTKSASKELVLQDTINMCDCYLRDYYLRDGGILSILGSYETGFTFSVPSTLSSFTNNAGFITASSSNTLTNKSGNISQWTNNTGYLTSEVDGSTSNEIQTLSYNSGTGQLSISGGNTITIPAATPTINYTPARTVNTSFTPSKSSIGFYSITCSATNPLLIGASTATAKAQYYNGSAWVDVATVANSNSVALAVSVQLTNAQTGLLCFPMNAGTQYRINTATSGTATVTLVNQAEIAF